MGNTVHDNIWLSGDRGSGKSAWLCERYVQLTTAGVSPNDILLLAMDEARARHLCLQILRRLEGIWGGRIRSVGGLLADYAREVLACRGHPIYPLRPASRWQLYDWLRNRLADDLKILANHYLSIFDDWRKWDLHPALLRDISLGEHVRERWEELVTLYGEFCSHFDENLFSDLVSLAHLFSKDDSNEGFLPAHLLVDDAHELNVATWPVVSRLCRHATFALTLSPEGQLFEEVESTHLREVRGRAREMILGKPLDEPFTFEDRVARLVEGEGSDISWILFRAASPFEELLQGLLWARERCSTESVAIFLTSPMTQLELLLEAAAWLEVKLSLQGSFWSHWIPSLQGLESSESIAHGSLDPDRLMAASLWPNILFRHFLEDFERASEAQVSLDSPSQRLQFQEALEKGLLKCDFDSNIRLHRGIEVTTLERPDLAIGAHVWIVGLTRESLPGSTPRNPVFPAEAAEELQSKLAANGHPVKLQLARSMSSFFRDSQCKLLDVLARSKHDVLISCATKAWRNEPIAESPFFRALVKVARAERRPTQCSIQCVDFIHPISFAKGETVPSISRQLPATHALKSFPLSATALAEFIQCPRKFFYEKILELEIPERPAALLIGLLLHEAMAHFLAPGKEAIAPESQAIEEWIHNYCRSHDEFINLSEGVRYTLEKFVAKALNEFFASGDVWQGNIEDVERAFELSLPGGFSLRGRIDRIDLTAEGLEVIDYKSRRSFASAKLKDEFLKAEEWIQLPIYVKAAEALFNQPVAIASIIFFGLKGKDKARRTAAQITQEDRPTPEVRGTRGPIYRDELDETWARISRIVETIFREDQSFGRGENPPCEKSSLGCPFVRICPVSRAFDEESKEDNT